MSSRLSLTSLVIAGKGQIDGTDKHRITVQSSRDQHPDQQLTPTARFIIILLLAIRFGLYNRLLIVFFSSFILSFPFFTLPFPVIKSHATDDDDDNVVIDVHVRHNGNIMN